MDHFEKLGVFYLGRPYDARAGRSEAGYLLLESRQLTTHAVCVGMTGSGKTGLCIALLEEAAIDGIPALIIDPKGDMANLLLSFPDLAPADFRPWIQESEAQQAGLNPDEYAARQAQTWREGLAAWGQDGERIRRMRQTANFKLYTPGSTAGEPLSIVQSLKPPASLDDPELWQEQVSNLTDSLLSLIGQSTGSLHSREHILIANLIANSWQDGSALDLAGLIRQIQDPPLRQVGIMDLETFYPAKDRLALALQLNNLLASPGFAAWLKGEPLDIDRMLYAPDGKPQLAICSIAHLGDTERMFFVSLLLSQMLGWMRSQTGTTSLRAILYMDEIFGYFPPVANPPSKKPLLTLLKQARAYGLGVVLTTQNPVDLDYKGLANAGTWLIGRLQTERDKQRVMEGLEGAALSQGSRFDRTEMERQLAGLANRVFLMHSVYRDQPVLFQTRWCLSYLRGPLSRSQLQQLKTTPVTTGSAKQAGAEAHPVRSSPLPVTIVAPTDTVTSTAPPLPAEIRLLVVPVRVPVGSPAEILYRPGVLGLAQIGYRDAKTGLQFSQELMAATAVSDQVFPVDWDQAFTMPFALSDLESIGMTGARYDDLPAPARVLRNYTAWQRDFTDWVYRTHRLNLLQYPVMKLSAKPGEEEGAFRVRLQQHLREMRDRELDTLKQKYALRIKALEEKVRKAEQAVDREKQQARQQQMQTAISFGATLLSAIMGKKALSASTLGRATTTVKGASRSLKEKSDIARSNETVEAYQQQLKALEDAFAADTDALAARFDPMQIELTTVTLQPFKKDIMVKGLVFAWLPWRQTGQGLLEPAWTTADST